MKDLILSLKIFISWILLMILFLVVGNTLFGQSTSVNLLSLANWDGRHFLDISKNGYTQNIQYAFFPLYPSLISFLAKILNNNYLLSGLIINLISVFGIIYYFNKIIEDYDPKIKLKTLLYFLIFPTSFYLLAIYSEATFLLFTLMSFYFAKQNKFYLSALFVSLTLITRISGAAVFAFYAYEIYKSRKTLKEKIILMTISLSGMAGYCVYLYLATGNPFYFLISELTWDRSITLPGLNIFAAVEYLATFGIKPESYSIFFDLLFTVFGLGIAIKVWRNLNIKYSIYTSVSLLLPLTTALLLSMPRFILVIFPLFIVLSKIKNRVFNISYVLISLTLLFLFVNFFIRNIWVS